MSTKTDDNTTALETAINSTRRSKDKAAKEGDARVHVAMLRAEAALLQIQAERAEQAVQAVLFLQDDQGTGVGR